MEKKFCVFHYFISFVYICFCRFNINFNLFCFAAASFLNSTITFINQYSTQKQKKKQQQGNKTKYIFEEKENLFWINNHHCLCLLIVFVFLFLFFSSLEYKYVSRHQKSIFFFLIRFYIYLLLLNTYIILLNKQTIIMECSLAIRDNTPSGQT